MNFPVLEPRNEEIWEVAMQLRKESEEKFRVIR